MRSVFLRLLRVPGRPDPPPGSDDSLTTFRASERFFYYQCIGWGFKQLGALLGILLSFAALRGWYLPFLPAEAAPAIDNMWQGLEQVELNAGPLVLELPFAALLSWLEVLFSVVFVLQLVISGFLLRLGWEMRWYMVSNESLRIREGLVFVREQTMTVANIQNMKIKQGPIQKLFRISDLEVRTAGGGGTVEGADTSGGANDFHVGHFRGIGNAHELRDRLREILAKHRDSGLGDPDEHHDAVVLPSVPQPSSLDLGADLGAPTVGSAEGSAPAPLVAAARAALAEASALRRAVDASA